MCISPVTVILVGMSNMIKDSWESPCKFAKSLLLRSGKESNTGLAAVALLCWDMLTWEQPEGSVAKLQGNCKVQGIAQ